MEVVIDHRAVDFASVVSVLLEVTCLEVVICHPVEEFE